MKPFACILIVLLFAASALAAKPKHDPPPQHHQATHQAQHHAAPVHHPGQRPLLHGQFNGQMAHVIHMTAHNAWRSMAMAFGPYWDRHVGYYPEMVYDAASRRWLWIVRNRYGNVVYRGWSPAAPAVAPTY